MILYIPIVSKPNLRLCFFRSRNSGDLVKFQNLSWDDMYGWMNGANSDIADFNPEDGYSEHDLENFQFFNYQFFIFSIFIFLFFFIFFSR